MDKIKKTPNRFLRRARRWTPDVVKEVINNVTAPYVWEVVTGVTGHFRHAPKVLDKDQLYEVGLRMLKQARRSITVVNTVGGEDSQNYVLDWGNAYQKEYFEGLFGIVQKNRHGIGEPLIIRRYMDLNDIQKCEEAISLLLYGDRIEVCDSTIPIEFLIRDDEEVLLGFPDEHLLSHGVKLSSRSVCTTLNKWIDLNNVSVQNLAEKSPPVGDAGAQEASEAGDEPRPAQTAFKDPQRIVRHIREKREVNRKPISDHSLIHAMHLLSRIGVENPLDATKDAFDGFINWYPELYDEGDSEFCYKALAEYIKELMRKAHPTLLDVGCAHGLGANILDMNGIEYWGVDTSEELLNKAKHRLVQHSRNFIAGDMMKVLLDRKRRTYLSRMTGADAEPQSLPDKLDVIACQGNTFDFFLGDLQKWFALTLFKSRLADGGVLFITQKSFTKGERRVERKLPAPHGGTYTIVYELEWSGDFVKINVSIEGRFLGTVIQHPTNPEWLIDTCQKAGFTFVDDAKRNLPKWFGPRGGKPYDVYVFQLAE